MEKMDSHVIKVQLALFFIEPLERPDKLLTSLNANFGDTFDNIPTVIPLPGDAPTNLPVVQLTSKKGDYQCNIAKKRIDLIFTPPTEISDFDEIRGLFDDNASKILDVLRKSKIRLNRVGFVVSYFISDRAPTPKLKNLFLVKDLGELNDITIRYNQKKDFKGIPLNDITQLQTGVAKIKRSKKGFIIQRDINNKVKKNVTLNIGFIKTFLRHFYPTVSKCKIGELI